MKNILFLLSLALGLVMAGCGKFEHKSLFDDEAPNPVTDVTVENTHGGAILSYKVPKGSNLMYVEANVTDSKGRKRQFKTSFYDNSIEIEGMSDTSPREVTLYAVSRSGKKSVATPIDIEPLTPPYLDIFNNLRMAPDFGGVFAEFENQFGINFSIGLVGTDSIGNFGLLDQYFSKEEGGNHTFRSYPIEEKRYGLFIRDQWDNISDTLYQNITPLFETLMDKSLFKHVDLPGEPPLVNAWNVEWSFAWDGYWSTCFSCSNWYGDYTNIQTEGKKVLDPTWITIDMGQLAKVSRFVIHPYWRYENTCMKRFEFWGKADIDGSGSWDGWIKLGEYSVDKPSGLPPGQFSQADDDLWTAGWQGNFDPSAPPVRYIRIRNLESYSGTTDMNFQELNMYGSPN